MEYDVFISYSHKDVAIADAVCHRIEAEGIRCWYAPRNIKPGQEWAGAIVEAIEHASVMILIFTDYSNTSAQVHREVDSAVSSGVRIIPFKCTTTIPSAGMKYYLSALHWLDAMDKPLADAIEVLTAHVKGLLTSSGESVSPAVSAGSSPIPTDSNATVLTAQKKKRRKTMLIGAASVLLVFAAILTVLLVNGAKKESVDSAQVSASTSTADATAVQTTENPTVTEAQQAEASVSGDSQSTDSQNESVVSDAATDSSDGGGFGDADATTEQFVFDENNDSPYADDYLYSISEYYSDNYSQSVRLDAYFGDTVIEVVEVPAIIDGLPVTQIYEKCFEERTTIKQVILPDTMESIDYRAFQGCTNLSQINFPASLTSIGAWSLADTGFTSVIFPDTVTYIGNGVLYSCNNLETVVVSRSVTEIEYDSFRSNSKLKSITIPAGVLTIDIDALRNSEQATIIGVKGSYAEKYAKGKGMTFQEYDG